MEIATIVAVMQAGALASAAAGDVHAITHRPPLTIADLPMAGGAAWPVHRCGEGTPATDESTAAGAIDASCVRLTVRERAGWRRSSGRWSNGGGHGGGGGDSGAGWRMVQAVLPGLQGLVGPGGMGLGIGSELQFVRGAHMTLHLAAPRDTRIADTAFAPETTVLARCGACWTQGEAMGAGLKDVRRAPSSAAR